MFTKQHYEAIAKILDGKTCVQILSDNPSLYLLKQQVVEALANMFEEDNERFNRNKFFDACYTSPDVLKVISS